MDVVGGDHVARTREQFEEAGKKMGSNLLSLGPSTKISSALEKGRPLLAEIGILAQVPDALLELAGAEVLRPQEGPGDVPPGKDVVCNYFRTVVVGTGAVDQGEGTGAGEGTDLDDEVWAK